LGFPGFFTLAGNETSALAGEKAGDTKEREEEPSDFSCFGGQTNGTADHSPHRFHCSLVCPFMIRLIEQIMMVAIMMQRMVQKIAPIEMSFLIIGEFP
jgi:hypothetical protein